MLALDFLASEIAAVLFALLLFGAMMVFLEIGRRVGVARRAADPVGATAGLGAIEGAVFALLGLLIAFTFSGAATRFDWRRQLVIEETNDIGTAYLRLDLLPAEAQPRLRKMVRTYVDSRIESYRKLPDIAAAKAELMRSIGMQGEIWTAAIAAARDSPQATMLLLPALNAMFDITTTRTVATQMHPPGVIFVMLAILAMACSLLAGVGMGASQTRSWIHMIGFAALMAFAIYVIIDLEHPRVGLIRVDSIDQVLVDLRQGMKD